MATSLYDMSVASYLQITGGALNVMDKGAAHCEASGKDVNDLVSLRLCDDMLPFHFQIVSVVHHSLGAVKGLHSGEFRPPSGYPDTDYAGLREMLQSAHDELAAMSAEQINDLSGGEVVFRFGEHAVPYTTESFVLSFSHPNLYFHATTAYDLLRQAGIALGKRDYLGRVRTGTG
jgi:hypothetical protein